MSRIFMFPYAKTMAFGGVATGSIKAKEAEMVTGSIRYSGLIWRLFACGGLQQPAIHSNTQQ